MTTIPEKLFKQKIKAKYHQLTNATQYPNANHKKMVRHDEYQILNTSIKIQELIGRRKPKQ
jgi:hypothetical protein